MTAPTCRCCAGALHPGPAAAGRRALMGAGLATAAVVALGPPPRVARAADPVPKTTLTPDQALRLLKENNDDFRTEAPFCVLVGCSDSRVPPELLFGRGLGELFIVRNAGNTVDTAALGSVEYGVGVLGCPLIVVLGHERCGAVAAAVEVVETNATFPGVIGEMIQPIMPAVLASRGASGDRLHNAVVANARRVASRLRTQSAVLQDALRAGRLKVVAANYDLDDGDVDFFEDA